jgi:hypothetical protein
MVPRGVRGYSCESKQRRQDDFSALHFSFSSVALNR